MEKKTIVVRAPLPVCYVGREKLDTARLDKFYLFNIPVGPPKEGKVYGISRPQ